MIRTMTVATGQMRQIANQLLLEAPADTMSGNVLQVIMMIRMIRMIRMIMMIMMIMMIRMIRMIASTSHYLSSSRISR